MSWAKRWVDSGLYFSETLTPFSSESFRNFDPIFMCTVYLGALRGQRFFPSARNLCQDFCYFPLSVLSPVWLAWRGSGFLCVRGLPVFGGSGASMGVFQKLTKAL